MMQPNELLIKNCIEKADEALTDAKNNIDLSLRLVQNRIYYAIFYVVLALAYFDGFATGKHHQLMGWFNKEYIYKNKIFDAKLKTIYQTLLANREKFDYDVSKNPEKDRVEKDFKDAIFFVETVKQYILEKCYSKYLLS